MGMHNAMSLLQSVSIPIPGKVKQLGTCSDSHCMHCIPVVQHIGTVHTVVGSASGSAASDVLGSGWLGSDKVELSWGISSKCCCFFLETSESLKNLTRGFWN